MSRVQVPVQRSSDFFLWLDLEAFVSDLVFFGLVTTFSSVSGAGLYLSTNKEKCTRYTGYLLIINFM